MTPRSQRSMTLVERVYIGYEPKRPQGPVYQSEIDELLSSYTQTQKAWQDVQGSADALQAEVPKGWEYGSPVVALESDTAVISLHAWKDVP